MEVEIALNIDERIDGFSVSLSNINGEFELQKIMLLAKKPYIDAFVFLGMIVFFEVLYVFILKADRQKRMDLLVVLTLAIITCIPLMNGYQIKDQDDMIVHAGRIGAIVDWLHNYSWNQPIMRLDSNAHSGYGYVIPTMYPQMFLFVPAFLKCIGISMLNSIKIFMFLMNLGTAYIALFSFEKITKKRQVAILSTVVYMFSIYRLVDIYTRAAMGEYLAMMFLPLVLLGLYEVFFGNKEKWIYLTYGISGVLQSHIITTFLVGIMVLGVVAICFCFVKQRLERIFALMKAGVMTILMNLWFLIPFVMNYPDMSVGGKIDSFAETTISLKKMLAVFVESTRAQAGENAAKSDMPLSIGLALTLAIIVCVWSIITKRDKQWEENHRYIAYGCLTSGIISLWLSSDLFNWAWIINNQVGKYFTVMQFAWRFLTLASVFLSLLAGIVFYNLMNKKVKGTVVGWLIILAVTCIPSFYYMESLRDKDTVSKSGMETWEHHDFLYLPKGSGAEVIDDEAVIVSSEVTDKIDMVNKEYSSMQCEIEHCIVTDSERYLDFPLFYYYGYKAEDENGEVLEIQKKADGTMRVCLEDNTSFVHVWFKEPLLWRVCTMVSVISLVGCVVMMRRRVE